MAASHGQILARWQAKLIGVDCSPMEFFEMVENAVIERELPDVSFSLVMRREGGWFSPRRMYLRIRCRKLYFDVSAFVVGNSLIVGWWLHQALPGVADLFAELPGIGFILRKTTRAATYYAVDFIEYFQRAVHDSILRLIDDLTKENEAAFLPDEARQPVWEELW